MSVLLLVLGVVLFIGLVVIHELGHFIVARRNGVQVEEFGIFFPPRLYKKKTKGGWDFTINALPLGGFVRLKGEHDSDTEPGTFGAASLWVKSKIMAAGVVMNLITALVLFTIIALVGMPKLVDNQYTVKSDTQLVTQDVVLSYIEPGSPAAKAGLETQDIVTDIGLTGYSPVAITSADQSRTVTKQFAGKTAIIYYIRAGHHHEALATLRTVKVVTASQNTNNPKGYLGVIPEDFSLQRSTWSAPVVALGLSSQLTVLTFQGIGNALGGVGSIIAGAATHNTVARQNGQSAASTVSGPYGIFEILKGGSLLGYQVVLFVVAYISLALAIMNILPIPPVDGSKLWFTLITRAIKRPLSAKREEAINIAGFILFIILFIIITIVDVRR